MAIYVFKMKTFSRNAGSRGSRSTSAAAYRAGERIRDLRTGLLYDHRQRADVLHKQIVLPTALAASGSAPEWAADRAALWNAAEQAETRGNARVAREYVLALPHELSAAGRQQLAQRFAQHLADRYHVAVDLVLHAPRGDPRNYHAHLLTTTREAGSDGLGRKAQLELSGTEQRRRGLASWWQERAGLREHWAGLTNQALREAGLEVSVSHQLPATRDLNHSPRLPQTAYYIERAGRHSFVAERIRARHQAALERAQAERSVEPEPAQAERRPAREPVAMSPAMSPTLSSSDEQARRSAQRWLEYRKGIEARGLERGGLDSQLSAERSASREHEHEHDQGLDLGM